MKEATIELTAEEVEAVARVLACAELAAIPRELASRFGPEFRVSYDSVLLKLSRLETRLGTIDPLSSQEADDIAIFASDLDQRRAALEEERRRGETDRP